MINEGFALSCPGNLLLCGEYAILEEGGKGICLAPDLRSWLVALPRPLTLPLAGEPEKTGMELLVLTRQKPRSEPLVVWQGVLRDGHTGGSSPGASSSHGASGASGADPLVQAVLDTLEGPIPGTGPEGTGGSSWTVLVDSSGFHAADGTKLGLGSSAAASLLLCGFFYLLQNREDADMPGPVTAAHPESLLQSPGICMHAVRAHRRFQGGKGSGYDVWTSFLGGVSIFTGGTIPQASPLAIQSRELPGFVILQGSKPQKTVSAIASYNAWSRANPHLAAGYVQDCNRRATEFAQTRSWHDMEDILQSARTAGLELGRAIGCPADFAPPQELAPGTFLKATGAGNENAIAFTKRLESGRTPGRGLTLHHISQGWSRGKLALFGEHAALQGYPACGTALPQSLVAIAVHRMDSPQTPGTWDMSHCEENLDSIRENIILNPVTNKESASKVLFILSAVPRTGGYGSSAALSASLTRLVAVIKDMELDPGEEWAESNRIDSLFHGRASGMDTGLSLSDGLCILDPRAETGQNPPTQPLFVRRHIPPAGIWIVHAATKRSGNTKNLVQAVRKALSDTSPATLIYRDAMTRLGTTCRAAASLVEHMACGPVSPEARSRLPREFGLLADAAQQELATLGLVSAACASFLQSARMAGSLGGKMSGAGGGGAFFCVCPDRTTAEAVAKSWELQARQHELPALAALPCILMV